MPDIKIPKNIPFLSFIARTWHVLAFVVVCNLLVLWNHAWYWVDSGVKDEWGNVVWRGVTTVEIFGSIIYVLPLVSLAVWLGLLLLSMHNRKTIEKDANSGRYMADWDAIGPVHRVWNTTAMRGIFIIAAAIIAAAVAK